MTVDTMLMEAAEWHAMYRAAAKCARGLHRTAIGYDVLAKRLPHKADHYHREGARLRKESWAYLDQAKDYRHRLRWQEAA